MYELQWISDLSKMMALDQAFFLPLPFNIETIRKDYQNTVAALDETIRKTHHDWNQTVSTVSHILFCLIE